MPRTESPLPKRIPVAELRPGMYLHKLPCSWLDHPFVRQQFLIEDWETIEKIRHLPVEFVDIDARQGDDVDSNSSPEGTEQVQAAPARAANPRPVDKVMGVWRDTVSTVGSIMSEVRIGRQPQMQTVESAVGDMMEVVANHPQALFGLGHVRSKDRYTFEHCVSVGFLALSFAKAIGLDEKKTFQIGVGALLHDIGKVWTPDEILNKPGKLAPEEMEIMKGHAVHTRSIISELALSKAAFAAAVHHHERIDGSGYPAALAGDQLSVAARIVAICDVYDAMTADRCYRRGVAPGRALRVLLERAGSHYDETLVHRFIRFVGIYPPGALVRLSGERLAVVTGQGEHVLYPRVRVFYDALRRCEVAPKDLQLGPDTFEQIVAHEKPVTWGLKPDDLLLLALE